MKTWHLLVLAGTILVGSLGGSAIIAAALRSSPADRYDYNSSSTLAGSLARIDKVTGAVQIYDPVSGTWVDFRTPKPVGQ